MHASIKADARIELRASRPAKDLLERAARLANKTISACVLETMLKRAEEEVTQSQTFTLKEQDSAAFLAAISSPPEPNKELRRFFAQTNP
ncbi:MAG: DUF1778 domain-containing protein [Spirochaetales bacterium]